MAFDLLVPAGLAPVAGTDSKRVFQGQATTGLREAPGPARRVTCDPNEVVRVTWADGLELTFRAEDLLPKSAAANGDAVAVATLPPRGEARALIVDAIVKLVVGAAPSAGAAVLAGEIDGVQAKLGLHTLSRASAATGSPSVGGRSLVLVHGTFATTSMAFGELVGSTEWVPIADAFPSIYGFDHPTLSVSPLENALALAQALPENTEIELVSHSRGGLVGDVLAAAAHPGALTLANADRARLSGGDEIKRLRDGFADLAERCRARGLRVTGHIRVGCPARGTTLASRRLDTWLDVTRNVVGHAFGRREGTLFDRLGDFVAAVVAERADPRTLPGLWCMLPDGPFVRWLAGRRAADRLRVIAGVSPRETWLQQIVATLGEAFFQGESDLVVDTAAMSGGAARDEATDLLVLRDGNGTRGVHHLAYFASANVRAHIRDHLTPTTGSPATMRGGSSGRSPAIVAGRALLPPTPSGTRPIVVLVPDTFASCLAKTDAASGAQSDDVWPAIPALAEGGLASLAITSALSARAVVAGPYARLVEHLVRHPTDGVDVVAFPWDWRRSVRDAAEQLAQCLAGLTTTAGRPIHLLAHGAGGLVARGLVVWHGERWAALRKSGGRLVMLGTPQQGAHRMVRVLLGDDPLPRMLVAIHLGPEVRTAAAELRTFPGLVELLPADPDGDPALSAAFLEGSWPTATAPAPLTAAAEVRRDLASAHATDPDGMRCIVGHALATPANLPNEPAMEAATGDGAALWSHARLPGVPSYLGRAVHGTLADAPHLFAAITDLLLTGETRRLGLLSDRPVTGKPRDARREVRHPDEADLVRAALVGADDEALWTLNVDVFHGDLALQKGAVLAGHAAGLGLRGAEPNLDLALGGALSQRLQVRRYPQSVGTAAVVPTQNRDVGVGNPLPEVAVIVGLGAEDDLSRTLLAEAVAAGVVEAARPPASTCFTTSAAGIALSAALPEVGPRSLTLDEAVNGVLEGVVRANRELQRGGLSDRRVGTLTLVLPYGDEAAEALRVARRWLTSPGIVLELAEEVAVASVLRFQKIAGEVEGQEALAPQRPIRTSRPVRFRRITASAIGDDPAGPSAVLYTVPSEDSRAWRVPHEVTWETLAEATSTLVERAELTRDRLIQIRDHAVPLEIALQFDTGFDLQISVDRWTAAIPWEAFISEGADGASLLSGRISILRQYQDERAPSERPVVANSAALLIGAPGPPEHLLPSVKKEIADVQRRLQDSDFMVTAVDDLSASRVREVLCHGYEVVHIAGHGVYTRGDPRRTGLLLAGGQVIGTRDLRHFIREPPALVFLNCCHLGRVDHADKALSHGSLTADLATCLIQAGVNAVVAAGWAVRDAGAEAFARELYTHLLTGQSFRNAVAQARLAARQAAPDSPTWAAYQCYGDPDFVLPSAVGARNNVDAELLVHLARTEFVTPLEAEDALGQVIGRLAMTPSDEIAKRRFVDASVRFVERLPNTLRSEKVMRRLQALRTRPLDRATATTKPVESRPLEGAAPTLQAFVSPPSEPAGGLEAIVSLPTAATAEAPPAAPPADPIEAAVSRIEAAFDELRAEWDARADEAPVPSDEAVEPAADASGGDSTFARNVARASRAVGRIHVDAGAQHFAAGFLVAPGRVMTAGYVAAHLAAPGGAPGSVRTGARIVFTDGQTSRESPILAIRFRDEPWDVAIVDIDEVHDRDALALSTTPPSLAASLVVLAYALAQGDTPGRPVMSVGHVVDTSAAGGPPALLAHDADSPLGAAGAPVLDRSTWNVIGIEHSGNTTGARLAVPAWRVVAERDLAKHGVAIATLEKLLREIDALARYEGARAALEMTRLVRTLRSTRVVAAPTATTAEERKRRGSHARGTELLHAFQARFPKLLDDPLAGAFGGRNERQGFRVDARVEREGKRPYWRVIGRVSGPAGRGDPSLHLHPTFREPTVALAWKQVGPGVQADFRFGAVGAFTLGVEIPPVGAATDAQQGNSSFVEQRPQRKASRGAPAASEGAVLLELDLSEADGADEDFRTR